MTRLTLSLAALALMAGAAGAQETRTRTQDRTGTPAVTEPADTRTGVGVGKDIPDTYKAGSDQAAAARRDANRGDLDRRGSRGTGVATGFVAAGIGLALLGLFVRRRNRHDRYDDLNRPGV